MKANNPNKQVLWLTGFYIENMHVHLVCAESYNSLKEYFVPSGVAIPLWTGHELCQFQSSLFQLKWAVYRQRNDLPQCSVNQPKTNSNILLLSESSFLRGWHRAPLPAEDLCPGLGMLAVSVWQPFTPPQSCREVMCGRKPHLVSISFNTTPHISVVKAAVLSADRIDITWDQSHTQSAARLSYTFILQTYFPLQSNSSKQWAKEKQ